jgi:6-phosphogluconolactonase
MLTRRKALVASALSPLALAGATIGQARAGGGGGPSGGAVFAMSNVTADNVVVSFRRGSDGRLTRVGSVSTRGRGIGTDLDTTGGLRLSADRRFLYAVNAGSDDVTVFAVNGTRLRFLQKVPAGDVPNSITLRGDLLYVLLGSVAGNGITGFRIGSDGRLTPIANSFRFLSSPIAVPGQIQFSPDGRFLLVTHKVSDVEAGPPNNAIDVFAIGRDGTPSEARRRASFGLRPFSLDIRRDGVVVVVESFNAAVGTSAASSYRLSGGGNLSVVTGSVRNAQTDVCWVVITGDGRYVYAANFGSGTISSYSLGRGGELALLNGRAAFLGEASQPVDLALSADSRFLYLLTRGFGAVAPFRINEDGSLRALGDPVGGGGLPVNDGASGLAAY